MNHKPDLTDEQNQANLTDMIEMDADEIDDCLKFLGMNKTKWEQMWGPYKKQNKKDKDVTSRK